MVQFSGSTIVLELPDDLQEQVETGELPARGAYEIAKLGDDAIRSDLAEAVRDRGMTVEDTREVVRRRQGRSATNSCGTREQWKQPGGILVAVSSRRKLSDSEIEVALARALDAVCDRMQSARPIRSSEPL